MQRLTGNDSIWLQDRSENLMLINSLVFVDRLPHDELVRLFRERLTEGPLAERYRRMRQRVVIRGKHAYWQDDPSFEIGRHLIERDDPALRNRAGLETYVSERASVPLDPARPLWEVEVIQGYEGDRTALYYRIHHCIGDGVALMRVMLSLMDPTDNADGADVSLRKPQGLLPLELKAALAAPFVLIKHLARRPDRSSLHGEPLTGRKRVCWSEPYPLETFRRIRERYRCTLNDALMAILTGALARTGTDLGSELRAAVPINLRSPTKPPKLENYFTAVLIDLPVGTADFEERTERVHSVMNRIKRGIEPLALFGAGRALLRILPGRWSAALLDYLADKCTCVLTNVPGPARTISLGGRPVRDLMFWVPQRASIGLGISILSYAGTVRVGVLADTAVMNDPQALLDAFEAELKGTDLFLN